MAGLNIVPVTKSNFDKEVLQSPVPVLVDFWGEWCGPCKALHPFLNELSGKCAGKAKIVSVDVAEAQDLAAEYHVHGIPTLLLFKGQGDNQPEYMDHRDRKKLEEVLTGKSSTRA